MRMRLGIASVALVGLSACGGGSVAEKVVPEPTREDLGSVSSVVDLRDALVAAGYDCADWKQENLVDLAAESGTCDDSTVLSTFASGADLQTQLETTREMDDMFVDAGVETDPSLVGPNWIFHAPDAGDYAEALGGTIVGPPSMDGTE